MMLISKTLFYLTFLSSTFATIQINFHQTDWKNINHDNIALYHDCLHISISIKKEEDPYQIISFCMNELSTIWNIEENKLTKKFTFIELYELHVTSEQLYHWSASMDLIEDYQFYLNQISTTNNIALEKQIFYNCTPPKFGNLCQYSFDYYRSDYLSLNEFIHDYYVKNKYKSNTMTCYMHLKCNRGSSLMCLDWSEICDGIIDCMDGIDEQYCWPLEIHQCQDNEFQCYNRQCIPKSFVLEYKDYPDCLDGSDAIQNKNRILGQGITGEPTFLFEDMVCLSIRTLSRTHFTRSCKKERENLLFQAMLSEQPQLTSDICWSAFKCIIHIPDSTNIDCDNFCANEKCKKIIEEHCPNMLYIPSVPILFGHIYLAYTKEDIEYIPDESFYPQYICYNNELCGGFPFTSKPLSFNNTTCYPSRNFINNFLAPFLWSANSAYLSYLFEDMYRCNTIQNHESTICKPPNMYQCINSSKCISKERLCNGYIDCKHEDDEQCYSLNGTCSINGFTDFFYCSENHKCIASELAQDTTCDCPHDEYGLCEDYISSMDHIYKYISFPHICDGFIELIPVIIDGQNETDETGCEYWTCNNTYTRCNKFWNCYDGADEVDCDPSPLIKCPIHHHICVSPETNQFICLSIEKANDGNIDCLGGIDEPKLCRSNNAIASGWNFYCKNDTLKSCITSRDVCNTAKRQCMYGDSLQFCHKNITSLFGSICLPFYVTNSTDVEQYFCTRPTDISKDWSTYFSIDSTNDLIQNTRNNSVNVILPQSSNTQTIYEYKKQCNRGLDLRVWLNIKENHTNITCLCPPSYYGNMCQYQNQRISLTIQFLVYSNSRRIPFIIIVYLIDDTYERIIHSYEQLTYLSMRDCQTKFNIYLLYLNRLKNLTKNYFIHIDIHEKLSLIYRGSSLITCDFPFLPVHRIATPIYIPRTNNDIEYCIDRQCKNGKCIKYFNNKNGTFFCQCNQGWSGKYCTIQYNCLCSSDSLCIGISSNNRSICICPINKYGSRCLLQSTICELNKSITCYNNGQCIPINEDIIAEKKFKCICSKGYFGEYCELIDTKIILSFDKNLILPQSMMIHFIRVMLKSNPENGTTFKTIPIIHDSVIVYWSQPFHIAFIEFSNEYYYLILVQKIFQSSLTITKKINSNDRCIYFNDIFNETIIKLHPLRRIKYFQLPCQIYTPQLSCFYDENYFCYCYQFGNKRLANCFEYNFTKKYDCFGRSHCENGGKCLQDNVKCPETSLCVCPHCFYGSNCQFRSSGFGHSLDALLGYHILPKINIWHQPIILKISGLLTIIMTGAGFINNIVGIIIFREQRLRTTGCALYLLSSSICSLFIVIMFSLKFWTLIISQIQSITNRIFLQFQCLFIDIILRICLSCDQWLNACVSIDQAINTVQGFQFNKDKSKKIAKYLICLIIIFTIGTAIHEPFHRHLIDEDNNDEKRIWCIVTYSNNVQLYDSIINIFHFFIPFIINLVAPIIIIIKTIRQQTVLQNPQTRRRYIREQFQLQKHTILSPILLVILTSPSVVIYLVSSCIESANDSELFLAGYFMSFSPSMLTFFLFILPSKLYKEEFLQILERYKLRIRAQFRRCLSRSNN